MEGNSWIYLVRKVLSIIVVVVVGTMMMTMIGITIIITITIDIVIINITIAIITTTTTRSINNSHKDKNSFYYAFRGHKVLYTTYVIDMVHDIRYFLQPGVHSIHKYSTQHNVLQAIQSQAL